MFREIKDEENAWLDFLVTICCFNYPPSLVIHESSELLDIFLIDFLFLKPAWELPLWELSLSYAANNKRACHGWNPLWAINPPLHVSHCYAQIYIKIFFLQIIISNISCHWISWAICVSCSYLELLCYKFRWLIIVSITSLIFFFWLGVLPTFLMGTGFT